MGYNISCTHVVEKMNINLCLLFRLVCHLAEKVCEGHEELEDRGLHSEHGVSQQDSETPES